jgi:hypothetical protein
MKYKKSLIEFGDITPRYGRKLLSSNTSSTDAIPKSIISPLINSFPPSNVILAMFPLSSLILFPILGIAFVEHQ